jgi:hypothetical protein
MRKKDTLCWSRRWRFWLECWMYPLRISAGTYKSLRTFRILLNHSFKTRHDRFFLHHFYPQSPRYSTLYSGITIGYSLCYWQLLQCIKTRTKADVDWYVQRLNFQNSAHAIRSVGRCGGFSTSAETFCGLIPTVATNFTNKIKRNCRAIMNYNIPVFWMWCGVLGWDWKFLFGPGTLEKKDNRLLRNVANHTRYDAASHSRRLKSSVTR